MTTKVRKTLTDVDCVRKQRTVWSAHTKIGTMPGSFGYFHAQPMVGRVLYYSDLADGPWDIPVKVQVTQISLDGRVFCDRL